MRELGAAAAAAVALLASPYLAGLTLTVPDRSITSWWKPRTTSKGRCTVTAAAAVTLAVLAGTATGLGSSWPAYLVLAVLGAVLVVVDVEQHRLPNRLLAPLAIAGAVLLTLAAGLDDDWGRLGRAALGVLAVGVIFYLLALAAPRSVGLGDVKLAALLAGYLAWRAWLTMYAGLAGGFLAAGVAALVLLGVGRANRSTPVPMGPFLIVAALLATAIHP